MKKILFVSHSAELNGAELWLLETLKRLDRADSMRRLWSFRGRACSRMPPGIGASRPASSP